MQIDEEGVMSAHNQIKDINNLLTFITIDFYDHETQHSPISEG